MQAPVIGKARSGLAEPPPERKIEHVFQQNPSQPRRKHDAH